MYIFTVRVVSYKGRILWWMDLYIYSKDACNCLPREYSVMVGSVYLLQGWSSTEGVFCDGWFIIVAVMIASYRGSIL